MNKEFFLNVRIAEPSDVEMLIPLMNEYIVDFYGRPQPPIEKLDSLIKILLEKRQGIQFIAEENGKFVGFATLYFTFSTLKADKVVILNDFYVVESKRGTEVAAQLFKKCCTYTNENGFASMSWETAHDNKRAQQFYEKMGASKGDWLSYSI